MTDLELFLLICLGVAIVALIVGAGLLLRIWGAPREPTAAEQAIARHRTAFARKRELRGLANAEVVRLKRGGEKSS